MTDWTQVLVGDGITVRIALLMAVVLVNLITAELTANRRNLVGSSLILLGLALYPISVALPDGWRFLLALLQTAGAVTAVWLATVSLLESIPFRRHAVRQNALGR